MSSPRISRRLAQNIRPLAGLLAVVAVLWLVDRLPTSTGATGDVSDCAAIPAAFEARDSDVLVECEGIVVRTLADDNRGSRHQRFIVEIAAGHTVLISHNIDLAPRIDELQNGDRVRFRGEYEYNDRGGVVHWTHADPNGRRAGGWLEHAGQRYR